MKLLLFWVVLAYGVSHIVIFLYTSAQSAFHVLQNEYLVLVLIALPLSTLVLALFAQSRLNGLRLWSTIGFIVAVCAITFAHFAILAALAASV